MLLTREGVAKIADVGLAKFMTREFFTGDANGTFAYASPELLLGRPCTEKVRWHQCFWVEDRKFELMKGILQTWQTFNNAASQLTAEEFFLSYSSSCCKTC